MSRPFQITDQDALYFVTATIVDWVDLFTRPSYKDLIIDSLNFCIAKKGLEVYAYVIMTNHLHLIVRSTTGQLSATLRDFKKYTARNMIHLVMKEAESRREWLLHRFRWNAGNYTDRMEHQVWIHGNHPISMVSLPFLIQKIHYIHMNPVKAGIVVFPEDYIYSSAFELSGRGNKLPISIIE